MWWNANHYSNKCKANSVICIWEWGKGILLDFSNNNTLVARFLLGLKVWNTHHRYWILVSHYLLWRWSQNRYLDHSAPTLCICMFSVKVLRCDFISKYVGHLVFVPGSGDRHHSGGRTDGGCCGSAQVHVHAQVSKAGFFDKGNIVAQNCAVSSKWYGIILYRWYLAWSMRCRVYWSSFHQHHS